MLANYRITQIQTCRSKHLVSPKKLNATKNGYVLKSTEKKVKEDGVDGTKRQIFQPLDPKRICIQLWFTLDDEWGKTDQTGLCTCYYIIPVSPGLVNSHCPNASH